MIKKMIMIRHVVLACSMGVLAATAIPAATSTAASCSASNVQSAINAASAGDTVNIPAGSCSWPANSVTLSKAITLNGAGQGSTTIDVSAGNPTFTINKQSTGVVRITNITFTAENNYNLPNPILIEGAWLGTQPVIFQNDTFTVNNVRMIDSFSAGGVIFSHITFNGQWDDFFLTVKDGSNTNSWTTADTMGSKDTTGTENIYVEDSTFNGGDNGVFDCDDNCRIVVRHNTFSESGGFNSHGEDSSTWGMRHFEIYNNSFLFPDKTCASGNTSLSNINQYIWLRGATGVIYNNNFDSLSSECWGTKSEIRLSIRGAEDDRPQGSCSAVHYPVPHQLGQNYNGSSAFTDPIYIWGNTGNNGVDPNGYTIEVSGGWAWGNPCGFNWNTFFEWGRDGQNTGLKLPITLGSSGGTVEGVGGTAKPGYTPYTYPHPLVQGTSTAPPSVAPPANLTAVAN